MRRRIESYEVTSEREVTYKREAASEREAACKREVAFEREVIYEREVTRLALMAMAITGKSIIIILPARHVWANRFFSHCRLVFEKTCGQNDISLHSVTLTCGQIQLFPHMRIFGALKVDGNCFFLIKRLFWRPKTIRSNTFSHIAHTIF
ncbi:MAG: hypothetical protein PUJ57_03040 [Peptoniphilaceae bacterium]|nr:hypothetical protein [Peptoniphilaceae bacterium]